jgi:hypothetical protein
VRRNVERLKKEIVRKRKGNGKEMGQVYPEKFLFGERGLPRESGSVLGRLLKESSKDGEGMRSGGGGRAKKSEEGDESGHARGVEREREPTATTASLILDREDGTVSRHKKCVRGGHYSGPFDAGPLKNQAKSNNENTKEKKRKRRGKGGTRTEREGSR